MPRRLLSAVMPSSSWHAAAGPRASSSTEPSTSCAMRTSSASSSIVSARAFRGGFSGHSACEPKGGRDGPHRIAPVHLTGHEHHVYTPLVALRVFRCCRRNRHHALRPPAVRAPRMTAFAPAARLAHARQSVRRAPGEIMGLVFICGLVLSSAVAVAIMGPWALAIPLYVGLLACAILAPERAALMLLTLAIAFEPGAIDISKPVSAVLYQMPPGFTKPFGLTMTPVEALTALIALSLLLHSRPQSQAR